MTNGTVDDTDDDEESVHSTGAQPQGSASASTTSSTDSSSTSTGTVSSTDSNSVSSSTGSSSTSSTSKDELSATSVNSRIFRPPRAEPGTRLHRALRELDTDYNWTIPEEREGSGDDESHPDDKLAKLALVSIIPGARDPLTFDEAWFHPDPIEREHWREAVTKVIQMRN